MKKALLMLFAALGVIPVACHSQVPPTSHTLTITVTNAPCAAGVPASTCGYVFSFAIVTGSTCPATTGTSYTPANQGALVTQPATGDATYVDSAHSGESVCAIGQTQAGSAVSQPSAAIGPFTIPANPTAPALGTGTVSQNTTPQIQPTQQMAKLELKAEVR